MNRLEKTSTSAQIHLERRLPSYWRVTFDHPPLNIFGPETIPQLNEIITALETDEEVKVVVFDSAVEGFFLTHYDFFAPLEESTRIPPGPTGSAGASRHAGPSQPRAGRIHCLDPRPRDGGRQRARAGERHAVRQPRKGHPVAMGGRRRPGAGRRTDGPAAAPDRPRPRARSAARRRRHRTANSPNATATSIAPCRMPSSMASSTRWRRGSRRSTNRRSPRPSASSNAASLPPDAEIAPEWDAFLASAQRPASQNRIKTLVERGFHRAGDVENRLGFHVGQLGG